ncbi:MAG: guanylate kinase [Candidatus Omnitrophica bacterium]|nr:guanylate kinase [Candidatus Omnitrophota bacterium]
MIAKSGKLIIISAPSGCGKTTIVERLLERNQDLMRSISYTTRPPRAGETSGQDYFFISKEEFLEKEKQGFFLEWAEVFGHLYGTSQQFVRKAIREGKKMVLAIDVQGMKQVKANKDKGLSLISIFIMPPSMEDLKARLEKRKTETKAQIEERLTIAEQEMRQKLLYDYVVINQDVEQAVKEIEELI